MSYYWSSYNYMSKSEKYGWMLYSGLSGSCVTLDDLIHSQILRFNESGIIEFDDDTISTFINIGALLTEPEDDIIRKILLNTCKRQNANINHITIVPTHDCNFSCFYCFMKKNTDMKYITNESIHRIVSYLAGLNGPISIDWFGGEPLLAFDKIKLFYNQINEKEIKIVQTNIITNGFLLTTEKLDYFQELNSPVSIQVTLDGTASFHDKRRKLKNNSGTFDQILNNIDLIYNNNYDNLLLKLRCNLDQSNYVNAMEIFNLIQEKYHGKFQFQFSPVESFNDCIDSNVSEFNSNLFSEFIYDIYFKEGIINQVFLPDGTVRPYGCKATYFNTLTIDYDEKIYKCSMDFGDETMALGKLGETIKNIDIESRYIIGSNPFNIKKCKDCFLILSCWGGCPQERIRAIRKNTEPKCHFAKDDPNKFLEAHIKSILDSSRYTETIN